MPTELPGIDIQATISDSEIVDAPTFRSAYGEALEATLDLSTWQLGADMSGLFARLEEEISEAVRQEDEMSRNIRETVFPLIRSAPHAPKDAGCYQAKPDDIVSAQKQILFNGNAEVCDGTSVEHDTLPITITQIGVALVAYNGDQQSFSHRLFRRDLRSSSGNMREDVLALLDNRAARGSTDTDERGKLSELARRGIMAYAERAVLTYKSQATWRLGHGNPIPYELLTGSGSMELLTKSLPILKELVLNRRKILFVPSAPTDRRLLTIAQSLRPLEYVIMKGCEDLLLRIVENGHYQQKYREQARQFCHEVGPSLVYGVFRASKAAPGFVFYAHADHAHEAAVIALADSVLQEHRGFPMLIDLADSICRTTFGNDVFSSAVQSAYARAGEPFRYMTERQTRP